MTYLIDTDVVFDGMSARSEAIKAIGMIASTGLQISIVTLGEIYDGVSRPGDPLTRIADAERFLLPFQILNLDAMTMRTFGGIRSRLRQRGRIIRDFDILIAATAINLDLLLVTRNEKHFGQIDKLRFASPSDVLRGERPLST